MGFPYNGAEGAENCVLAYIIYCSNRRDPKEHPPNGLPIPAQSLWCPQSDGGVVTKIK